jgi:hypothetical protein
MGVKLDHYRNWFIVESAARTLWRYLDCDYTNGSGAVIQGINMSDTYTPFLNLTKPDIGGDVNTWGLLLNGNMDSIDTGVKAASTTANAAVINGTSATDSITMNWQGTYNPTDLSFAIAGTGYATFWHSANFTPSNYVPVAGGTMTGALTANAHVTINSTLSVNSSVTVSGGSYGFSSGTFLQSDGNIYGSCWNNGFSGGYMSNYFVPRRNANANGGFVETNSGNALVLNWDGSRVHAYVDGTDEGQLWTSANFNPGSYATVGANCPWNSGIAEIGQVAAGVAQTVDGGSPWVLEGLRTQSGPGWIYLRAVYLRNN